MIDLSRWSIREFSQQNHQEIADAILAVPQKQLLVARAAAGEEASGSDDMMGIPWE